MSEKKSKEDRRAEEYRRLVPPEMFGDVVKFHQKFGIQYDGPPRILPYDLSVFRRKRLAEEHREFLDAMDARQMPEALDGLVDLVYIALGTAHLHGWDFNEAWRRIHAANMAKVRVESADKSRHNHSSDIVKPEGWVAPDLTDLCVEVPNV